MADDPGLFERVPIVATFEFERLASDTGGDGDMVAMWLSEDATLDGARLLEFSIDGVMFRKTASGFWAGDDEDGPE